MFIDFLSKLLLWVVTLPFVIISFFIEMILGSVFGIKESSVQTIKNVIYPLFGLVLGILIKDEKIDKFMTLLSSFNISSILVPMLMLSIFCSIIGMFDLLIEDANSEKNLFTKKNFKEAIEKSILLAIATLGFIFICITISFLFSK